MNTLILHENEFAVFQKLIYSEVGIDLAASKRMLVQSRLTKRLHLYKLNSFVDYLRLVQINAKERIEMINLITTNETYFFREIQHFEYLQNFILKQYTSLKMFRFWSAAASVGAEAYSAAMLIANTRTSNSWEVVGTDINSEVIQKARIGLYPERWADKVPLPLKQKFCLKGKGKQEGQFLVDRVLVENMIFTTSNLMYHNKEVGLFDVIFLRNVLIYFDDETKQLVIDNVVKNLKVGGYFFISLTENLNMLNIPNLEVVETSVYKKIK